jgi:putative hydrolase of the HAD superfamily
MEIRAVIFDFGGVLCFHPTDQQIRSAADACGMSTADFLTFFWANRRAYDAGDIGPEQYWQEIASKARRRFDPGLIEEMILREIDFWTRYDQRMLAWNQELREHGLRTGILSNLPSPLGQHLRATQFEKLFHHATFSYELNLVKPQAAIYQHMIEGLGISPAEALFIDDRSENVEGARAVGLQAHLFVSWDAFLAEGPSRYGLPTPAVARRQ